VERGQAADNNVAPVRKRFAVLASVCLLGLLVAGPAAGAGLTPPVADCYSHGRLTQSYSVSELRHALATMPADVKEYSVCYDIIQGALLKKIGTLHGAGSSGSGGSFLPVWLIVVLAVLVAGGTGFGALALRERGRRS
jgi:hypothetical protein